MSKNRSYSVEFKRQVAQEFIAGETLHGLSKRHDSNIWGVRPSPDTQANTLFQIFATRVGRQFR